MFLYICIFFLVFTVAIAVYQANFYNAHMADGKTLSHPLWFAIYCIPIAVDYLIWKNWEHIATAFLIRGVFFDPLLNLLRKPSKPFFYINGVSGNAGTSWWDSMLLKISKNAAWIWVIELLGLGALLFLNLRS